MKGFSILVEKNRILTPIILVFLALVIFFSGFSKLLSLSETVEEFYKWLLFTPVGFIEKGSLRIIIIVVSTSEILLSLLMSIPTRIRDYSLLITSIFLFCMILLNLYQISTGFESCGCFGTIINLSPEVTLLKTFLLFLLTIISFRLSKVGKK